MNFKKTILILVLIVIITGLIIAVVYNSNKDTTPSNENLNIVVTSFSTYDFIRQIAGDNVNLTFLMGPGKDSHSYEPTIQDSIKIQNADLFIYIGGNMEKWADKILDVPEVKKVSSFKLTDIITLQEEQHVDGAEEDGDEHNHDEDNNETEHTSEYDEHIWTSPANSIIIAQELINLLSENDPTNRAIYEENGQNYIEKIKNVQSQIWDIVNNRVRNRLVFADKMPMQYFLNEFGLTASAAFNGCSTEAEPNPATIAYLTDKIKEEHIPVVLYIELNIGKVADIIANETGIESMQIQSLHNVSRTDFENGETYVSLMTKNLEVLKKALQ